MATTAMSSEQNVSVSCILLVVNGLQNNFLKTCSTDIPLLKMFKRTISSDVNKRILENLSTDSFTSTSQEP